MRRLGSSRKLAAFNEIRQQLSEQQRCVEARAEAQTAVLLELQELCRRRAELEADYSRALERLATRARHKADQAQGPLAVCWRLLAENTNGVSRQHQTLSRVCGTRVGVRLARAAEDATRIRRRARLTMTHRHGQLAAALADAAATNKNRLAMAQEWRNQAIKLKQATLARERVAAADPPQQKKLRHQDKELQKRVSRHTAARVRALRARADHTLSTEAAAATLQHYYADDLPDFMDCMDVGIQRVVSRAMCTLADVDRRRAAHLVSGADALQACVEAMDPHSDRLRYLETHTRPPILPRRLHYAGPEPDEEDRELAALAGIEENDSTPELAQELTQRLRSLENLAERLRAECAEYCKTLDAAEERLLDKMEGAVEEWRLEREADVGDTPDDADSRRQQEDYFLEKFGEYLLGAGRLARVEGKLPALRELLGAASVRRTGVPRRNRTAASAAPALCPLLADAAAVLGRAGARTTGVFRVSAAQAEVAALLAAYERGERPLAERGRGRGARDVHAVAALLKLHLRRRRPPPLGPEVRAALTAGPARVGPVAAALAGLRGPELVCVRHVCGLLRFLSRCGRTQMDSWNLAVCVGPSLLPAAAGDLAQQNLFNDIVKIMIDHHDEVFPLDIAANTLFVPPSEEEVDPEPQEREEDVWVPRVAAEDSEPPSVRTPPSEEDDILDIYHEPSDAEEERGSARQESEDEGEHHDEEVGDAEAGAHSRSLTKSTPDLVLDLPAQTDDKRQEGATGGSNTARMAAKFADLTLTGGSRR